MHRLIAHSLAATTLAAFFGNPALADEAESRRNCESLALLNAPAFEVETAEWVAASTGGQGPGPARAAAPAHCLFRVMMDARPSSIVNVTLGIGFELRLPLDWNGRFLFQGGGRLNGVLNAAFGNVSGAPSALARGFAVVSTDGGHRGSMIDSSFAADQQAKLDFAYQAVQRTTYEAKT